MTVYPMWIHKAREVVEGIRHPGTMDDVEWDDFVDMISGILDRLELIDGRLNHMDEQKRIEQANARFADSPRWWVP